MSEEFTKIREVLDFYLDEKGEPWARFIAEDDQRGFPLKSLVVLAQLDEAVKQDKKKLDTLMFECVRHATKKYRPKQERDDDILEEDGLVVAILNYLARLKKSGRKPEFTGTIQELRTALLEGPPEERNAEVKKKGKELIEENDWPKLPHKFAIYLRARENVLASFRVQLTSKRKGTARLYTLKYTGIDSGIQHVQVTDPNGDLFEMLGLYDPKPTVTQDDAKNVPQASQPANGGPTVTQDDAQKAPQASSPEGAVTQDDAGKAPVASPPTNGERPVTHDDVGKPLPASQPENVQPTVTQDDAQKAPQASHANKEGKHVTERVTGPQETEQELQEPSSEELPQK